MIELSLEQQFAQVTFFGQCDRMSREQAIAMCKTLYEHLVLQKLAYNELLKTHWNIEDHGLNQRPTEREQPAT